jgi:hypothetical protein
VRFAASLSAGRFTDGRYPWLAAAAAAGSTPSARFVDAFMSRQHQAGRSNGGGAQSPHEINPIAVGQTTVDDEHGVRVVSDGKRRRVHPVENVSLDAGAE